MINILVNINKLDLVLFIQIKVLHLVKIKDMKVQELRVGNLVMRENYIINKYDKVTNHEIVVSHNDITACTISPDSFQPIVITEERLIELGFEECLLIDNVYGFAYTKNTQFIYLNSGQVRFNCEEDGAIFLGEKVLNHVHQLQNLYFALTGEELIK